MATIFTWLDGHTERVEVVAVREDRTFVDWAESRRVVEGSRLSPPLRPGPVHVERPSSWVESSRLTEEN